MNRVDIVGRIYNEVEVKQSQNGKALTRFGVAVQRTYKNSEGKYDSDFISCVAYGTTADYIGKYFSKGQRIGISGHIQTGSYTDKNNVKHYTTDVIVDAAEFVENKSSNGTQNNQPTNINQNTGFTSADIDSLPFN